MRASLQSSHNNTSRRGGGQTSRTQAARGSREHRGTSGPGAAADGGGSGSLGGDGEVGQSLHLGECGHLRGWDNGQRSPAGGALGRSEGALGHVAGEFFLRTLERDETRHSNDPEGKHSLTI